MNPLADLRDIHLSENIGLWPLAYGWWIALILVLLMLVFGTRMLLNYLRTRRAKRKALALIDAIDASHNAPIAELNQILKRVSLNYFDREQVASMHSNTWIKFLLLTSRNKGDSIQGDLESFQNALYKPQQTIADIEQYKSACKQWINAALPPSKKVLLKLQEAQNV